MYTRKIRTGEGDNHILRFRYEFDGYLHDLNLKQTRGRPLNLAKQKPDLMYKSALPIPRLKINDLQKMCKSGAIPAKYHAFYESLFVNENQVNQADE